MKKGKLKIIIGTIIVIVVVIIIIVGKNKKNMENEIQPVIYYSFNDEAKKPLIEDDIVAGSPKITWTAECSGIIKKDGKEISNTGDILLIEDGTYEISVKEPTGKNKITKNITIDKTPPEFEIKENESGSYTIIFADINDVETATLTRLNLQTKQIEEEKDLKANGLEKSIEIKDKGYYILKATDKLGNMINGKTKFKIQ